VTCAAAAPPLRGGAEPQVIEDAALAWDEKGRVTYAGPRGAYEGPLNERFAEAAVIPGFVDCHTHIPFVGWRDDEHEARLAGRSYRDLHGEGGIGRSARMLAEASDEEVMGFSRALTDEALAHGTTALELKTGYGLSVEAELRHARIARRLADEIPQTATVTLLAAHAVPPGWRRQDWVRTACAELIPAAAAEDLVDAVDVYVEDIAFTVEDLREIAHAAFAHGLPVRCHADQFGPSHAAEVAAAIGARSADHLNHISRAGVQALGREDIAAVLLPTSTLMLREVAPPVADLATGGAALALATDANPGTSPVVSMPEAIAVGCALYGLAPLAAIPAATINAAWVLSLDDRLGSLEPGKRADFLVLDAPHPRALAYRPGHDPVQAVYLNGEPVGP